MCGYLSKSLQFSQAIYRRFSAMTGEQLSSSSSSSSSSPSSIQGLYELCNQTFKRSASSPPSQAIQKVSSLLDTITSTDVGLKENEEDDKGHGLFGFNVFSRANRWAQPITYIDVHECDGFTMCIFCFPTSSVIPLHDHPGMTVLSKVLHGSLHVKAYDWVKPTRVEKNNGTKVRLAKLVVDKVVTAPCDTSILYPNSGGNLHCFTAITPCAVLDILAPPYSESAGRICTYYHDYPYSSFSTRCNDEVGDSKEEEYAWLAEIETPADLYMRSGRYTGPAIHYSD
ncbi:plant cysteine oxidase 3 [Apium graveolens]|uniref:plant cysteine oxidase 3 n=1 Tax=Apium graveolens TaxID=4045 RepID=UPI003D78F531